MFTEKNLIIIFIGILCLILINMVLVIIALAKQARMIKTQKVFTTLFSGETVEDLLYKSLAQQEEIAEEALKIRKELLALENRQKTNFDRIGLVRYSASAENEARLSYSIGISNENEDGLVITALNYRNGMNLYTKYIKDGISDVELSEEEKKALSRTKLNKVYKTK